MENEEEFEDIEYVSKTQLKRESHEIQDLGKRLTALSADHLARIPLDEKVLDAIALARKISNKRSALKRQYQYLGKLLRSTDTDAIAEQLALIDNESQLSINRHHQAEHWRDRIINDGESVIEAFMSEWPNADRQQLRQLARNYDKAPNDQKKIQQSRLIYKAIKQFIDETA